MSNRNKLNKDTIDNAKVENQEEQTPVTPNPDEKGEPTDKQEDGKEEETGKEKEKFHLPKIKLPRIPLPSKKTVIEVLKGIALLLLGALTGAVAIVAAAMKISSAEKVADETEEDEIPMADENVEEELSSEPLTDSIDNIE